MEFKTFKSKATKETVGKFKPRTLGKTKIDLCSNCREIVERIDPVENFCRKCLKSLFGVEKT